MKNCDVLLVNSIGPAFTGETIRREGIGGSELEIVQLAEVLAEAGHNIVVANGVAEAETSYGVRYIPFKEAGGFDTRCLYIERGTILDTKEPINAQRIVVRATDIWCEFYEPHRKFFATGQVPVIGVSQWQLKGFRDAVAGCQTICIPPILGEMPEAKKVPGRFVFMSAPCKGLGPTLAQWVSMFDKYPEMKDCHLIIASPGHATGEAIQLSAYNSERCRVQYVGVPTVEAWRKLIATAEGLFYVNEMTETFCCTAAFAEMAQTRNHILCLNGKGGIPEALERDGLVTTDQQQFEKMFIQSIGKIQEKYPVRDRSAKGLLPQWEAALGLKVPAEVTQAIEKMEMPAFISPSDEAKMPQEPNPNPAFANPEDKEFFGSFLELLRGSLTVGGSELGLGMTLFSLAVSIRAADVAEIGRYRGFSTLALAAALKFNTVGWEETKAAAQRPDVDYQKFHAPKKRQLISIDKYAMPEAKTLIEKAGLADFVRYVDEDSRRVKLSGDGLDLLLIDGDHSYAGLRADVARHVPCVREGGYVVLHDYYGWWKDGKNGSAIAKIADELKNLGVQQLLVDTGYASLVVFRKTKSSSHKVPTPVPPRADGKPTVGLLIIAKNENPIVARALQSCRDWIDAVTVVVDADTTDGTAELCERLGAEVHVRPYAGSLAETRNEAIAIAEKRTDYLLLVDADDMIEGTRPEVLDKDIYDLMIHDGNILYPRGQLFRSGQGFRFEGCDRGCKMNVPHEYLTRPGAMYGGRLDCLKYKRLGAIRGASGWQDQAGQHAKYMRHAKDLEIHHLHHPEHLRTIFYIGQSYRDAGEPALALPWYRKRATIGDEEGWFSQLRVAEICHFLRQEKNIDMGDPVAEWLQALEMRRVRADPLVALAVYFRDDRRKKYEQAYIYAKAAAALKMPPNETLFMVPDMYSWVAKSEVALAAHYTGRHDEAVKTFSQILAVIPESERPWAHQTMAQLQAAFDQAKRNNAATQ